MESFPLEKQSVEFLLSQGIPFQRSTLLKGEQLEKEIEEEEELFPGKRKPSKKYPPIFKPGYRAKYPQLVYSEFGKPDFRQFGVGDLGYGVGAMTYPEKHRIIFNEQFFYKKVGPCYNLTRDLLSPPHLCYLHLFTMGRREVYGP